VPLGRKTTKTKKSFSPKPFKKRKLGSREKPENGNFWDKKRIGAVITVTHCSVKTLIAVVPVVDEQEA